MENLSKIDIKELIQEVLEERWGGLFGLLKRATKKDLFISFDDWMEKVLDQAGLYDGPSLPDFTRGEFVVDVTFPYTTDSLEQLQKWNKSFGEYNGVPHRDILSVNQRARERFYDEHPNAFLGEFPNYIYEKR